MRPGALLCSVTMANAYIPARVPMQQRMPAAARFISGQSKRVRMAVASPEVAERLITDNVGNNVTPYIAGLVGRDLHRIKDHPLGIIKSKIESYFGSLEGHGFDIVDSLDPLVNAQECFDDLLIPKDHPGRKPSDTYYVTRDGMLSAPQSPRPLGASPRALASLAALPSLIAGSRPRHKPATLPHRWARGLLVGGHAAAHAHVGAPVLAAA
jgi:phenylalanyl-tRNA synthetase alpha subunit